MSRTYRGIQLLYNFCINSSQDQVDPQCKHKNTALSQNNV